MGRHTFEGTALNGQPLPGRRNVVLSSDFGWAPPAGAVRAAHWLEALHLAHGGFGSRGYDDGASVIQVAEPADEREVFVIGGQLVYEQALGMPFCTHVFAAEIEHNKGDSGDGRISAETHRRRRRRRAGGEGGQRNVDSRAGNQEDIEDNEEQTNAQVENYQLDNRHDEEEEDKGDDEDDNDEWTADTYFPELPPDKWRRLSVGECPKAWASDRIVYENDIQLRFVTYARLGR